MLDCDASFVSVSEFASIRRSLPARLMAATALSDAPAEGLSPASPLAAPSASADRPSGSAVASALHPAFVDHIPAFDMPPLPVPPLADLRAEAARGLSPAPAEPAGEDADDAAPAATGDDPRPVTPRRPLRFTAARSAEDAAPVTLPSFNLFDGVFDDPTLQGPDIDPRLQRSRARARAQLAAMEAALSPVERNLWHDDPAPEPLTRQPATAEVATDRPAAAVDAMADHPAETQPEGAARPRRVRHITPSDTARTPRPEPQTRDPLRDRLHDLRAILYPQLDGDTAPPAPRQPTPFRQGRAFALAMLAVIGGLFLRLWPAMMPRRPANAAPDAALPPADRPAAQATSSPAPRLGLRLGIRLPAPRLAVAMAALALAIPVGLLVPTDLLPFL